MKVIIHDIPLLSGGWRKLAFADSTVLKETLYFLETCEPHNSALNKTDINIAGSNKLNDYYIYTSISEVILYLEEQAKEHALSKLSELEKHLLGLNKEVAEVEPVKEKPEIQIGGLYKSTMESRFLHLIPPDKKDYKLIMTGKEFRVIDKGVYFIIAQIGTNTPVVLNKQNFLDSFEFIEEYEDIPY